MAGRLRRRRYHHRDGRHLGHTASPHRRSLLGQPQGLRPRRGGQLPRAGERGGGPAPGQAPSGHRAGRGRRDQGRRWSAQPGRRPGPSRCARRRAGVAAGNHGRAGRTSPRGRRRERLQGPGAGPTHRRRGDRGCQRHRQRDVGRRSDQGHHPRLGGRAGVGSTARRGSRRGRCAGDPPEGCVGQRDPRSRDRSRLGLGRRVGARVARRRATFCDPGLDRSPAGGAR